MYIKHPLVLIGRSACGGTASGRAVVVRTPSDLDLVANGDILVTAETDITYIGAMMRSAALITETGGRFCHAAVWAREHGKPAILQVARATELLDGVDLVKVDASTGRIEWEK